jgi:hypothetical protein
MHLRLCALTVAVLTAGATVATTADAFFISSDRPPPNGSNGPSVTGFSAVGLANGVTVKAVSLQDGTVIRLK